MGPIIEKFPKNVEAWEGRIDNLQRLDAHEARGHEGVCCVGFNESGEVIKSLLFTIV